MISLTLLQKTVTGVKWNLASQGTQQVAQLLTTIVLARLLQPYDFGLVGMAIVVIGFLSLFKDLGTSAAVIQTREVTEELLSSVFWANTAFGCLITIMLAAAAPLAALFFHEPRVTAILRVLSLSFVISASSILQKTIFERELEFRITARAEAVGVIAGAVIGITSALMGAGVWALVAQSLTTASVVSVLLWSLSDWRPKMLFHWEEIRRVSRYSLNLTGFNTVNYLARNADYLLIGRFLGATSLGVYTLAYRIMLYPLQTVTTVTSRVMFPAYSQLQDDNARFRSVYLRTVAMTALVTFPMMVGIFTIAQPFVLSIFGENWAIVIPLIKILAPVGLMQSILATIGTIYQAKGRTTEFFVWGVASSSLIVAGFLVGLRWGVLGVATSYAIVMLVIIIPGFAIPFHFIDLRLTTLVASLVRPLAASILMALVVMAVSTVLTHIAQLAALQLLVATGVIAYIAGSWFVNRDQFRQVLALIGKKP